MGRENIIRYQKYDDEFFEMIPSARSEASLRETWTNNLSLSANTTVDQADYDARLWNDDFSHRPSWCDAHLALIQIRNGKASGNVPSLYMRAWLQKFLFQLGCFVEKHYWLVINVGLLILFGFSIFLKDVRIETDLEKLWVQKDGRLSEERNYVSNAFDMHLFQQKFNSSPTSATLNLSDNFRTNSKNYTSRSHALGGSQTEQFLMLIQTTEGSRQITKDDFLLHEAAMTSIAQMTIELFNETWSLSDICFRPIAPSLPPELQRVVGYLLDRMLPCVIITPLDCFWEGAKPNGPFPPVKVEGLLTLLSSFEKSTITWKDLDPLAVLDEIDSIHEVPALQTIRSLFFRAGISHAFLNRPCIEPIDAECPSMAPNHIRFCSIVDQVIEYNKKENNVLKLMSNEEFNKNRTENENTFFGEETDCEKYGDKIRKIILSDLDLYNRFVPTTAQVDLQHRLSGHCNGYAEKYMRWPDDLILGGVERRDGRIIRFEALESVFMLASAKDVFLRMEDSKKANIDRPWTLELANQIMTAWQRNFTHFINNHRLNVGKNGRIFHPLAGTSVNDMMKEFSEFNPTVIIVGYIFMIFYASLSLCSFSDGGVKSGVALGFFGCLLVTLAGIAGLGCSMILQIPFNVATTQIVPFLTLGLGVDDMFLLVHSYKEIVRHAHQNEIGFLLKETGLSALLTSINNVLAFLAGGLLPVPALRNFCLQVAILLAFNALSILTIYPAMMCLDLKRHKSSRIDVFCCFTSNRSLKSSKDDDVFKKKDVGVCNNSITARCPTGASELTTVANSNKEATQSDNNKPVTNYTQMCSRSSSRSYLTGSVNPSSGVGSFIIKESRYASFKHWTLHRFVSDHYNRWLALMPVKITVLCINVVLLAFGVMFSSRIVLGLELTDVIPKGTPAYAFLNARQTYFSFYPFNAIIKGFVDIPTNQKLLHEYRNAISNVSYVVKREGVVQEQFWLNLMRDYLLRIQNTYDNDTASGKFVYHPENNSLTINEGAKEESSIAFQLLCVVGTKIDCSTSNKIRLVDKNGIINPDGFYNYLTAWYNLDPLTYHVSRAAFSPTPPKWKATENITQFDTFAIPPAPKLLFHRIPFFLNGLIDTPAIVDMIQKIRATCDEYTQKGLPNFPEGIAFTFWEQYLDLRYNLLVALMIVIGCVFFVISFLLMSPWTSAIVVFVLVILIVELAGFMGFAGLKLNAVSAVSLITAVGIGVEFTVHISLSFLTSLGNRNERMDMTLNHMFIPVMHGGLSTLLGVIMLAFSEFEFIRGYFFMVLSALIVLGIFNGLLLLPVLLSMIGPSSEVRAQDGSHRLPPPTPFNNRKSDVLHKTTNVQVF